MNILSIDTSSNICSICLSVDSEVRTKEITGVKTHAQQLLPNIDELLAEFQLTISQLDKIVFGKGPGSFTGLRIAAACAQGLAVSHDINLYSVSSLACMAYQAYVKTNIQQILVLQDARMKQLYVGAYEFTELGMSELLPEQVLDPSVIEIPSNIKCIVGNGLTLYPNDIKYPDSIAELNIHTPSAEYLMPLAVIPCEPYQALPTYVRNNVVQEKK